MTIIMRKYLIFLIVFLIGLHIFLAAWYVMHGDIVFHTDIARDFLLLDEIDTKKIVLIGPRASGMEGLFHGPLWLYLNYPAYVLGNGNPVVVGWWWVTLITAFLAMSFFIARQLFNYTTALLFILLLSVNMIIPASNLYNPYGALFVLPLFFYLFIKYKETSSLKYLIAHLFTAGLLVQFEMAIGLPMLLLSSCAVVTGILKNKKYAHLLSFLILLIPLSTFLLFDIRHDFAQVKSVLRYFSGETKYEKMDWFTMIVHRLDLMFIGALQLFNGKFGILNVLVSFYLVLFSFTKLKTLKAHYKRIYLSFLYFYVGFFVLSLLHNGWLLNFYWLPLQSLVYLIVVSLGLHVNKKVFYIVFVLIYVSNIMQVTQVATQSPNFIGKSMSSWKFLESMENKVFEDAPDEFGLYIYTPDVLAYQAKYAVLYGQKTHPSKRMIFSEKRAVTYVLEEPPPKDRPYLVGTWWIKNRMNIEKEPDQIFTFPNGYLIKKYILSNKEVLISSDPLINDWVSMR